MKDAFALLKMNPDFVRDFPLQANLVHDSQVEKNVMRSIGRLQRIEELMLTDKESIAPKQTIDEVIRRARNEAKGAGSVKEWSSFELRILSYYMTQLHGDLNAFTYALNLLSNNWRNMFFNGLVSYILNNWNSMPEECKVKTCDIIKRKLSGYQDNNRKYLALKNHANFFDANGPMRMAAVMAHKTDPITAAPQLIGYRDTTFNFPYYSDVILNYLKLTNCDDLDDIEAILQKHTLDRTKKLILANLVEKADEEGTEMYQSSVGHFANRILGDISLPSTWAPFTGATIEETQKLKNARELVNKWYVRKVIDVFFDRCVQDPARRRFWMAYVPYIKDFRIAGSRAVKANLQNVDRIKDMFSNYFISTDSATSQTAALILMIKNKVFVEFSDHGALYVYNEGKSVIAFINKNRKYIDSTSSLKLTYLPVLVDQDGGYYYFKEEGRVPHAGYWQKRLHSWMRKMLSIVVTEDMGYVQERTTYHDDDEISLDNLFGFEEDDLEEDELDAEETEDKIYYHETVSYETGITYYASSKYLYDYRCSIVAGYSGFYLYLRNRETFVFLKKYITGEGPNPSIWVKRPDSNDYQEIVHSYNGNTVVVGYVKLQGDTVLYKESLNSYTCKMIAL